METIDCPRAKSDMTPCVARDGRSACYEDGTCVGCGEHPADLLADLVPKYAALRARVAALEAELDELKSFDGIMRQIDEHYPLDIPYFHDSNDPGCVAMRAQRQCLLATQRAEAAESRVAALEKVAEVSRALYGAGYWSRSREEGFTEEGDITYWEAMKAALAALEGRAGNGDL